jgi:hypothetical protein
MPSANSLSLNNVAFLATAGSGVTPLTLTGYGLEGIYDIGPDFYYDSYELAWTPQPGSTSYEVYMAEYTGTFSPAYLELLDTTGSLTYSAATRSIWDNTSYLKLAFMVVSLPGNEESNTIIGIAASPTPSPRYTYFRPGGIDNYLRPGSINTYIRP